MLARFRSTQALVLAIPLLLLSAAACGDDTPGPMDPGDPVDSTPPTVSLTSSSSMVTADGQVTLQATASDNVGVSSVRFLNGSTTLGTDTSAPFSLTVDLDATQNGALSFTAVARDAAGNEATSNAVSVDVAIRNFPFGEDFEDGEIDGNRWDTASTNASVAETNGRIEFAIPASIPNETSGAILRSQCLLTGEFDMIADYELLTWPAGSGVRLQMSANSTAERLSPGPNESIGESYVANHTPIGGGLDIIGTTDTSGALRIAREGNQFTSYYWGGADWVVIGTTALSSLDPVQVGLGMSVGAGFHGGVATLAAFDNFRVTSTGEPIC